MAPKLIGKVAVDENRDQPFIRWGEIDQKLTSLKTTEIALEMGEIIKTEENRIRFENRLNQNTAAVPAHFLRMQKQQTDEWVRRICQVYREVCVAQGGRISAEAVRAVFQHAIAPLFAARINGVRAGLTMEANRTARNTTQLRAMLESFTDEMERLKSRWSKKLEAEALECEHAESATRRNDHREQDERETNQPVHEGPTSEMKTTDRSAMSAARLPAAPAANGSPNWERLYEGFAELATEERALSPRVPGLIASMLPDSGHGADVAKWETYQSPSESLKGRFDLLATHAGAALGAVPRGAMPIDYWLHRLRQFLSEKKSKWLHDFMSTNGLTGKVSEYPVIDLVCEASALFCTQLEKVAFERTYDQGKELEACYKEWITQNFVSASLDRGNTYRGLVGLAARTAQVPIPIEFLSCYLDVALPPRGSVVFSCPSSVFDSIADTHKLQWWITERGLWMAQEPPSGIPFVDRSGSLVGLRRAERPLDPTEIKRAGVETKTLNAENESGTFECEDSANPTLKNPIQENASALDTKTRQTSICDSRAYRTPFEGLKPEMKTVDFSAAMLGAKLTEKQYDCYSLVKEYQLQMNEVEQRMGVTRKTIHEHITAAEKAMRKLSLKEYRAKAAAKHKHPE
jgi:predicted DNA-binding protein (UPF0251 family)